jgi:archaellum component FlaC
MMAVAETLASHTKKFEDELTQRTQIMENRIENLRKEVEELKKIKNLFGSNIYRFVYFISFF